MWYKFTTLNKLTMRYSLYQMFFFTVNAGIAAFAVTYLLNKGFQTTQIGMILAATNILSCVIQPVLGDFADRFHAFVLPKLIAVLLLVSIGCFALIQLCSPAAGLTGVLYVMGGVTVSVTVPLTNSLCAYYSKRNLPINFGIGAGVGSLSYSFASLGIGYVIAWMGADWMIWITLFSLVFQTVLVLGYPRIDQSDAEPDAVAPKSDQSVSILIFWWKYKLFSATILGVMLIAMCHAMSENYLVNIFSCMGGDSSNVGTALFIACLSAAPVLLFMDKIQGRIGFALLMRLSGIFYICKIFLMIKASTVMGVYLIELLQFCTYGFIYPLLYYFTKERVEDSDMVKGQAAAISLYLLGMALGNYIGGRMIDSLGVTQMLWVALLSAAAGTVVVNLMIGKTDHL